MHQLISSSLIVAAAFATGADVNPAARPSSLARQYIGAQTLVAVQGTRRLNLACVGKGKATVVFLSGLGRGTYDWRKVQPAIGRVARACAYDRAGYGYSDPMTGSSDLTNTKADLHALLRSKAITRPVILVGHSLGGLFATQYALRYPHDVAGVVLVDPAFSGQEGDFALAGGPAAAARLQTANKRTLAFLDNCITLAESGRLSSRAQQASPCLDNPPDPDARLHHELNRVARRASYHRAVRSEFENSNITGPGGQTINDRQSASAASSLGAMPLAILTREKSASLPGLSATEAASAERAWRDGHARLSRLSTGGTNRVVPNSGHFIQLDHPDAVIQQVLRIAGEARR